MEKEVFLLDAGLSQNSSRSLHHRDPSPRNNGYGIAVLLLLLTLPTNLGIRGNDHHDDFCFGTGCKILGRCDFGRKVTHAPWAITKLAFFCLSPCAWSDAEMMPTLQNFQLFQMSAFAVIVCRHRLQSLSKKGL
jgi:hypothetical protein